MESNKYTVRDSLSKQFQPKELAMLMENFAKFDVNGDGHIDAAELKAVMVLIGEKCDEKTLDELIKGADSDGDGEMNFEEFCQLVHHHKTNKTESKLVNAMKLAAKKHVPSKYVRLQNTRTVFGTEDPDKNVLEEEDLSVVFAVRASWFVNIALLFIKAYCYHVSESKAVLAALADSVVDLLSQVILAAGDYYANTPSNDYPLGRARIEALGVLTCAGVMIVASIEVIQEASGDLYDGLEGNEPDLSKSVVVYVILAIGVIMKLALWIYCTVANKGPDGKEKSDMLSALAEDHLNDVVSNTVAVITLAIAAHTVLWWFDPIGCIVISVAICYRWVDIMTDQTQKVVGMTAPQEFIDDLETLVRNHDDRIVDVDRVLAYHSGSNYNVEVDILLPLSMTVGESHDIAISVQDVLEDQPEVERANIHIDFMKRAVLEHKVERDLAKRAEKLAQEKTTSTSIKTPLIDDNSNNL